MTAWAPAANAAELMGRTGGPCAGCGKALALVWGPTFCRVCVDLGRGPGRPQR